MSSPKRFTVFLIVLLVLAGCFPTGITGTKAQKRSATARPRGLEYNVRAFGARGDGETLDTLAINQTIEAAAAKGGGTVLFPAGNYLSFSIHLRSNITLYLDQGATIVAADPNGAPKALNAGYDVPEPNEWDMYQDFGHSHWQNSLIWGIGLENVSILGPGLINGKGLTRRSPRPRRPVQAGDTPTSLGGGLPKAQVLSPLGEADDPVVMSRLGNKAISLKLCRNVLLRDFSILNGGHFALLATGVDNLTIDNVESTRIGMASTLMRVAMCAFQTAALTHQMTMLSSLRVRMHSALPAPLKT